MDIAVPQYSEAFKTRMVRRSKSALQIPLSNPLNREGIMAKKWIAGATKNKGGLHRALGVPVGKTIPASKLAAAKKSKNPKVKKEAILAQALKDLRKK